MRSAALPGGPCAVLVRHLTLTQATHVQQRRGRALLDDPREHIRQARRELGTERPRGSQHQARKPGRVEAGRGAGIALRLIAVALETGDFLSQPHAASVLAIRRGLRLVRLVLETLECASRFAASSSPAAVTALNASTAAALVRSSIASRAASLSSRLYARTSRATLARELRVELGNLPCQPLAPVVLPVRRRLLAFDIDAEIGQFRSRHPTHRREPANAARVVRRPMSRFGGRLYPKMQSAHACMTGRRFSSRSSRA